MKIYFARFLLASIAALSGYIFYGVSLAAEIRRDDISYYRADRRFAMVFSFDKALKYQSPSPRHLGVVWEGDRGTELVDCSDHKFRCIQWAPFALAVPRSGVRVNAVYEKEGIIFRVEECHADNDFEHAAICEIALISASCRYQVLERYSCFSSRSSVADGRLDAGFVTYFNIHRRYGVTSLGTVRTACRDKDCMWRQASRVTLAGPVGLLYEMNENSQ